MKRNMTSFLAAGFLVVTTHSMAQTPTPEVANAANAANAAEGDRALPNMPPHPIDASGARAHALREDRIEPSPDVTAGVIEVTTLDPRGGFLPRVLVELVPFHGMNRVGNAEPVMRALSNDQGKIKFTSVSESRGATYRLVTVVDGTRRGSPPFTMDPQTGMKAALHVYPVIRVTNEAPVIGRSFWFIESRDGVVLLEFLTEFLNLSESTWVPEGVNLQLPPGSTSFDSTGGDPDVIVKTTAQGVTLAGAVGPGRHLVNFSLQIPRNNESEVDLTLPLWPNTAEVRVATVARAGLNLFVEGYPETQLAQSKGQAPLIMTSRNFTRDVGGPPKDLHLTLRGLPVTGPGRFVATVLAALLAVFALLGSLVKDRHAKAAQVNPGEREALDRLLDELAELTRAHRKGFIGDETFAETQKDLVTACVRLERQLVSNGK